MAGFRSTVGSHSTGFLVPTVLLGSA